MAASIAELPETWGVTLGAPAEARQAMDFSRAPSHVLSMSAGAGASAPSQAGSLSDFAQLAYSCGESSIGRSSMSSLGSLAGTPRCSTEEGSCGASLAPAREGDAVVKLTACATAAVDRKPSSSSSAAAAIPCTNAAGSSASAASRFSLFSSAPPSLEPLPLRAGSPSLPLANSMRAASPSHSGSGSAGPPPDVLLAALSASLMAKKEQEELAATLAAGPAAAGPANSAAATAAAAAARPRPIQPACACASCHMAFADVVAYRAHCASQEHSVNIVHASLAMSMPRVAFATTGIPQSPFRHSASTAAIAAPAQALPAVPMPMVDPQLDALAHTLLKQLRQLDGMERAGAIATAATLAPLLPAERALAATGLQLPTLNPVLGAVTVTAPAVAADPAFPALPDTLLGASKPVRRLVGGLREARKAVKNGSAVAVVAAVDIQESNPFDRSAKPAADIAEICELARARGVAVVFALNRIGLGSVFGTNKRMSAVALTNVSGLEGPTRRMLQLAEIGRAQWAARLHATRQHVSIV